MSLTQPIENTSKIGRLGCALWQGWEWTLQACFALLCLRFLIVAIGEDPAARLSTLFIITGSFLLGFWRPTAALFAFTALVPFISGLTQTALLPGKAPLTIVFAALWLGMSIHRRPAQEKFGRVNASIPALAINLFASIIVWSLASECLAQANQPDFIACLKNQSWQAYSSPYYSITSAFIWLQGIFYIKKLHPDFHLLIKGKEHYFLNENANEVWVRPVLLIYGLTMVLFFSIQYRLGIPESWAFAGYQSPYDDISSFGSIAACLLTLCVATFFKSSTIKTANKVLLTTTAGVLLIASWSRAAWLAGAMACALALLFRFSWRSRIFFLLAIITSLFSLKNLSETSSWQDVSNPYRWRLGRLIKIENPLEKDPARLNLYRKAYAIISESPLTGKGIGSFYLQSVNYANPEDKLGSRPDFAHNTILQIAAELGLPAALFFVLLCGRNLWGGFLAWLKSRKPQGPPSSHALLVLGVTLSLGAYLQTQMTANSLNVYVSNQFFFWFMMAALLSLTTSREAPPQEGAARAG